MTFQELNVFFENAARKLEENILEFPEIRQVAEPLFHESVSNIKIYSQLGSFALSVGLGVAYKIIWERFLWNIDNSDRRPRELDYLLRTCEFARVKHFEYLQNIEKYESLSSQFPEILNLN